MPPKVRITKERIVAAAVDIVRRQGADQLNARSVAKELSCSTQPIFSNFTAMEELTHAVIAAAGALYREYAEKECQTGKYPPYKASGMAYIRFAREERELFKLLYMRDRSGDQTGDDGFGEILQVVQRGTGLAGEKAELFHLEMWAAVHGIAVMVATGYLELEEALISQMLTDLFQGLKKQYTEV
ncbi:MAG: TetR/AcrR family transcriptional regulator [Oscillospiraceae bacterium]|nr:TetR/AcrR family transcriptional regulator [Oscillospiraceae bacterium]